MWDAILKKGLLAVLCNDRFHTWHKQMLMDMLMRLHPAEKKKKLKEKLNAAFAIVIKRVSSFTIMADSAILLCQPCFIKEFVHLLLLPSSIEVITICHWLFEVGVGQDSAWHLLSILYGLKFLWY